MDPEASRLKRQQQALRTTYLWWLAGGFTFSLPFLGALVSIILFTPLAILFVGLALCPFLFLIFFQKHFRDAHVKTLEGAGFILSRGSLSYGLLILTMSTGSVVGWIIYSALVSGLFIRY